MKIIGISGGTRNGNNDAMCREALMGAECRGADVEFIRLLDLDLKPCTGCIACVGKIMSGRPSDCVIRDDYEWLSNKLLDADGVIMVMPIFESGTPAIYHILQDRFSGPAHDRGMNFVCSQIAKDNGGPGPDPRIMQDKFISYIGIGGSDWATRIEADFEMFSMSPAWTTIDKKVFGWSKSICMEDEKVSACRKVGIDLAEACKDPENAKYVGDAGVCPHCHTKEFYIHQDGTAECVVCGMRGRLKENEDGSMRFDFPEEELKRAHDTMSGKLIHASDIGKYEGRLADQKKSAEYKARMQAYKDFISSSTPENEIVKKA